MKDAVVAWAKRRDSGLQQLEDESRAGAPADAVAMARHTAAPTERWLVRFEM